MSETEVRDVTTKHSATRGVVDTWVAWWLAHQAGIPAGTWVAPTDAVQKSFRNGQLMLQRVQQFGPNDKLKERRMQQVWFPSRNSQGQWAIIHVDVAEHQVRIFGDFGASELGRTRSWLMARGVLNES